MDASGILQIVVYCAIVLALPPLLGGYMARVFTGERVLLDRLLGPVEHGIYRFCGIRPDPEHHWTAYAAAHVPFNMPGLAVLYARLRLPGMLPPTPAGPVPRPPGLAIPPPAQR